MNPFKKIGGGIGWLTGQLTGYTVAKKVLGKTKEIAADKTADYGLSLTAELVDRLKVKATARSETFAAACARQGINDAELQRIAEKFEAASRLYRLMGCVSLVATMVSIAIAEDIYWFLLYLITGLAATALSFAFAFRDTFRLWQIQRESLDSVSEFLQDDGIVKTLAG